MRQRHETSTVTLDPTQMRSQYTAPTLEAHLAAVEPAQVWPWGGPIETYWTHIPVGELGTEYARALVEAIEQNLPWIEAMAEDAYATARGPFQPHRIVGMCADCEANEYHGSIAPEPECGCACHLGYPGGRDGGTR